MLATSVMKELEKSACQLDHRSAEIGLHFLAETKWRAAGSDRCQARCMLPLHSGQSIISGWSQKTSLLPEDFRGSWVKC